MTWDQLIPVPIGSLMVFLLVVGYVLPTGGATTIVLWRDGNYKLSLATFGVSLVGCVNALFAYAYTPNLIDSLSWSGPFHDAVVVGQWWVFYHLFIDIVVAVVFLVAGVGLLKRHYATIGWQCLAVVGALAVAGLTYFHYDRALLALMHNRVPPLPFSKWLVLGLLITTGVFTFLALYRKLWDVLVAIAFKLFGQERSLRHWWPFGFVSIDRVSSAGLMARYMQQRFQPPFMHYHAARELPPNAHEVWREQQRRWRRTTRYGMWRYRVLPVVLYSAQFWGPPGPPEYRYYRLDEF